MDTAIRLGIDLGGTKIEGIVFASDGRCLARKRVPTPVGDYPGTLAAIANLIVGLESEAGVRAPRIGIGIPGSVSPATGFVKNANSTWLIGERLDHDLEDSLARPVRIANDANCFAVSEATDGAGAAANLVFGVILGTGVGGGLAIGGRVLTGANAIVGEWGHNPLPWPTDAERPGPTCYCGKTGCIETFLSGPGLANDVAPADGPLDAEAVVRRSAMGEAACVAALDRYMDRLARALASIINVVDPDIIVLGGGLSKIEALYSEIPRRWSDWVFSDTVATRLAPARHGDSSGVRGAAWLWPTDAA